MSEASFPDRFLATIAGVLLKSSSGRDVNPRGTKQWLEIINDFVGEVAIGEGDEARNVHVDHLLNTIGAKADALIAKINDRWSEFPAEDKRRLLAAVDEVKNKGAPLIKPSEETTAASKSGNRLERIFVGIVLFLFVGQQVEAAVRGHDPFYRALTIAQGLKSTTQFGGQLTSWAYSFGQICFLAFQRIVVPSPTSFAVESTAVRPADDLPEGYRPGTIAASLAVVLGYIAYKEWVGGANARYIIRAANFFLSPPEGVAQDRTDEIRREMGLEAEELRELSEILQKLRPDPDPKDHTKGLDSTASLQAGDYLKSMADLIALLALILKKTNRSSDKNAITCFAAGYAAIALISSSPLPSSFVVFLIWTIFLEWRLDQNAKEPSRKIVDSIELLGQAGVLVLFAMPWILAGIYYHFAKGENIYDKKGWAISVQVILPILNTFVSHLPGEAMAWSWNKSADKRAKAGETLKVVRDFLGRGLVPIVTHLGPILARMRPVAAALHELLTTMGFKKTEEAEALLRRLQAHDAEAAAAAAERLDLSMGIIIELLDQTARDEERFTEIDEDEDEDEADKFEKLDAQFKRLFEILEEALNEPEKTERPLETVSTDAIKMAIEEVMSSDSLDWDWSDFASLKDLADNLDELGDEMGKSNAYNELMFGDLKIE